MASALKDEIDRLKNSVHHLERSNKELQAELLANGRDEDYQTAIGENIVLLAKQKARIVSLEEELSAVEGGMSAMQDLPVKVAGAKGGDQEAGVWL